MSFPQGHALLIGVGTHQYHAGIDVPITVADAKAVADVLQNAKQCGYPSGQVKVIHNASATKAGILSALDQLAAQTSTEHTVFLFYCGHGALGTNGNYYLVSHDAQLQNGRVVADTGVSEGELLAKLRTLAAQRVILVFNACHSGNISPTLSLATAELAASNPDEEAASALLSTGQGRIILVACREQQVSYIGQGTNTIFTQALIDGLQGKGVRNNNGFISVFSLYEHLYETVRAVVQTQFNAIQEPELTVLKGVGPFAVARYRGANTLGDLDGSEALPEGTAVREVTSSRSERIFKQRMMQTGSGGVAIGPSAKAAGARGVVADIIHGPVSTGDHARQIQTDSYLERQTNTDGGTYVEGNVKTAGDFIGRDKKVRGDEVRGNKEQRKQVGGVRIGDVAGGIHDSVIAGRDAHQVQQGYATSDNQDDPIVQSPALQSLRTILSSLYETEVDARRIAQDAGLDIRQVNFSTKPLNFWQHVLVEAHKQAKVKALVASAGFEYPAKSEALRQAYQAYASSPQP